MRKVLTGERFAREQDILKTQKTAVDKSSPVASYLDSNCLSGGKAGIILKTDVTCCKIICFLQETCGCISVDGITFGRSLSCVIVVCENGVEFVFTEQGHKLP